MSWGSLATATRAACKLGSILDQVLELDKLLSQNEPIRFSSIRLRMAHPVEQHGKAFAAGSGATVENFVDVAGLKERSLRPRLSRPK